MLWRLKAIEEPPPQTEEIHEELSAQAPQFQWQGREMMQEEHPMQEEHSMHEGPPSQEGPSSQEGPLTWFLEYFGKLNETLK